MSPARTQMSVPAAAEAIAELLNTRPHDVRPDALDDPGTALRIVRRFDPDASVPPPLDEVRELRTDLVGVLTAPDDGAAARHWAAFTEHTAQVVFRQDFSTPGLVEPVQVAGDTVTGGIVRDVAELVGAGAWSRVRVCANPPCSWVFYDTTRSRTQRWHSYEICGNRSNVAAYRARAKSDA